MTRFKWNDQKNGRIINKYIDTICRDYPAIAKGIVKHGIDDLDSWFSDSKDNYADSCNVTNAKCGCLVGTTALVAMKKLPGAFKKVEPELNTGAECYDNRADGAIVLYRILAERSKRDISKYDEVSTSLVLDEDSDNPGIDPLLVLIYRAGMAASAEGNVQTNYAMNYDEMEQAQAARHKLVVDHFEDRIRKNLNIPYPRKKNASKKAVR